MSQCNNIVSSRVDKGQCPICKKPITKDFQVVEHNGKKVWICKHHYVSVPQEDIIKQATVEGMGC